MEDWPEHKSMDNTLLPLFPYEREKTAARVFSTLVFSTSKKITTNGQEKLIDIQEAIEIELRKHANRTNCPKDEILNQLQSFIDGCTNSKISSISGCITYREDRDHKTLVLKNALPEVLYKKRKQDKVSVSDKEIREIARLLELKTRERDRGMYGNDSLLDAPYDLCKIEHANMGDIRNKTAYINFSLTGGCRLRVLFFILEEINSIILIDFFFKKHDERENENKEQDNFFARCRKLIDEGLKNKKYIESCKEYQTIL